MDGNNLPRRRGSGKKSKCTGDSDKCWRCLQKGKKGCCRKKPTPCGKEGCVVCPREEGCRNAAATAAAQWHSSRIRRLTQKDAAPGPGSGEKEPKYATNAALMEAQKSRKKEQAKYQKKKEKKKENAQGTCHRSLASQSSIVAWCVLHIAQCGVM